MESWAQWGREHVNAGTWSSAGNNPFLGVDGTMQGALDKMIRAAERDEEKQAEDEKRRRKERRRHRKEERNKSAGPLYA